MTEPRPNLLSTPALVYAALAIAASVIPMSALSRIDARLQMTVVVILAVMLVLRTWLSGFLLVLMLLPTFEPETLQLDSYTVSYAASVLVFLIASSRYVGLTASQVASGERSPAFFSRSVFELLGDVLRRAKGRERSPGLSPRRMGHVTGAEFVTAGTMVAVAVFSAMMVLNWFPATFAAYEGLGRIQLQPVQLRTVFIGLLTVAVVSVFNTLMGTLALRRMSSTAAGIYLRSVVTRWTHREQRSMIRRQLGQRGWWPLRKRRMS